MPFATKVVHEVPPRSIWGEPRGRVKAIHIEPSGLHAQYLLEEAPGRITLRMKIGASDYSHEVFIPWRYTLIRVNANSRVESANCGYLYYATQQMKALEDVILFPGLLPNVFEYGGICLGYYNPVIDRSPVRAAWRTLRQLYSIPFNQWMWDLSVPYLFYSSRYYESCHNDRHLCNWAKASETLEKDLTRWEIFPKFSALSVLGNVNFPYQKEKELTEKDYLECEYRARTITFEEYSKKLEELRGKT